MTLAWDSGWYLAALAAVVVVIMIAVHLRYRQRTARVMGDDCEVVRLTAQGPIDVGSKGSIEVLGAETNRIPATIEEIDRQWLTISAPLSEATRLRPGASAQVLIPAGAAAYRFTAIVQDRRKRDDGLHVIFDRPAWVERVQRRSNFRVPIHLPTVVTRVDAVTPSSTVFRAMLDNLSGGGLTVEVPFRPDEGALMRVRVPLESLGHAMFDVRVLRHAPARMAHGGMWAAGCEFLRLDEVVQENVVHACFEIERAAKAKKA